MTIWLRLHLLICGLAVGVAAYHHEDPDGVSGFRVGGGDWISITLTVVATSLICTAIARVRR